jgi:hypothetical protein
MANMNSKVKFQVDKAAEVTLRATSASAITATTSEAGLSLRNGTAYWNANVTPYQTLAVNFIVKSIVSTGTYVLTVEVSDVVGGTYVVVGSVTVASIGVYTVNLDMDTVKKTLPTAGFIRVTATIGGTTPSLDYDAYLAPIVGA